MTRNLINSLLILLVIGLLVLLARYVRIGPTPTAVVVLQTSGMTCGSCAKKVTDLLQSQKGVAAADVDLAERRVAAGYDAAVVTPQALAAKLSSAGFMTEIQRVLTPAQYRETAGHDISAQRVRMSCCAGRDDNSEERSGCCNMGR